MININSNIEIILRAKLNQIQALQDNPDPVLRTVAMAVLPAFRKRIHVDGKDSSGNQIGTYSKGYMVLRTGSYKNAATYKRGEKAGQPKTSRKKGEAGKYTDRVITLDKNTGVFNGTEKEGTDRPVFNRTADTKVIISLTRQTENDLMVVPGNKSYGLGYLNPSSYNKAVWSEKTYNKKIFTKLTKEEGELAIETAQEFTPEYLKTLE